MSLMIRRAALVVVTALAVGCGSHDDDTAERPTTPAAKTTQPLPAAPADPGRATLQVAEDGCGVLRSEFAGPEPDNLQWLVTDSAGFEVLGRSATNEVRYRYFRPRSYTVHLQAWNGAGYAAVSDRVSISCP
jgi:hypothetical protein